MYCYLPQDKDWVRFIQCLKKLCFGQSADGYPFYEFTDGSGKSADGSDLGRFGTYTVYVFIPPSILNGLL